MRISAWSSDVCSSDLISERGDYANRVQGDAASHALNGAPYWTYMRRRAELSTQVFHSYGSEKALSYTRLVRYGGARPFPLVHYPPVGFTPFTQGPHFPFVFNAPSSTSCIPAPH